MKVKVIGANLSQRDDGTVVVALTMATTNTAYPGTQLTFALTFSVSLTAAQIKTAINAAVTLLWQAHGMPEWTV